MSCLELRYFFSKTKDLIINWHESFGGMYSLGFMEGAHNYNAAKAEMSQKSLLNGDTIDITPELSQFRADAGAADTNYLYFFCPYADPDIKNLAFEYEIKLNKNVVTLPAASGGESGETAMVPQALNEYERIQQIIGELKKDGNASSIQDKVVDANIKYSEVMKLEIKTDFGEKDSPEIIKVGHFGNMHTCED